MTLEQRLQKSAQLARLYSHRNNDPLWISRFKKFTQRPIAFTYLYAEKCHIPIPPKLWAHTFWGGRIKVPVHDQDAALLYYSGSIALKEYPLIRFLLKNLHPGIVFYDVGTNLGFLSSLGVSLGAEVHSFEPGPSVLTYTRENCQGALLNETALSDSMKPLLFYENDITKSGMSTAIKEAAIQNNYNFREIRVPATTLDHYIQSHSKPHIIKIDVEGFEEKVLRGGQNFLLTHSPILIMEVANRPAVKETTARAVNILNKFGYHPYSIQETGEIVPQEIKLDSINISENFCFLKH